MAARFQAVAGDIAVINSNELHYLQSLADDLNLYVIRVDLCQTKFLAPLSQNRITFHHLIRGDEQVELAKNANITVYHFCRTFKQITGKTITDYLNELRLEKSTDYLKKSSLNITEIALKCGFDSVNYYSRLFRRYYHLSPTKFRENNIS